MKKFYILLLMLVTFIPLVSCSETEYYVDGDFTAYQVSVHSNAPQVTYVTVTVEKGQIVKYDIDVRQGNYDATTANDVTSYSYTWKELTKKELGDDYNMKLYGTKYDLIDGAWVANEEEKPEYEWYEQANLIENYLLENGVDSVETIDDRISNVAGVTIQESGYLALAAEALELAKAGKYQAILCSADDLYIATMLMNKRGKISELQLDVLQGNPSGDTFAWKELTKQELGDGYNMAGVGDAYDFVEGEWVASNEKTSLEWYEQANLITDYIMANGWNEDFAALAGRGATIDGITLIDDLAGVTIRSQTYFDVLALLFDKAD